MMVDLKRQQPVFGKFRAKDTRRDEVSGCIKVEYIIYSFCCLKIPGLTCFGKAFIRSKLFKTCLHFFRSIQALKLNKNPGTEKRGHTASVVDYND